MSIPFSPILWLLAALPIVALLIMMVGLQWGAKKAAPIGLFLSIISALFVFRAPLDLVLFEGLKGIWSATIVLMIVWPAILLYEVVQKANAFHVIRKGIQKHTPNQLIQVLALGWCFTSFLQGITGFGVPVAVGAPLLIGIGVNPINAVIIPLIGNAWAGTFGTLAVAWDALVLQTDLSSNPDLYLQTALYAALFIWIWNMVIGVSISWIYGGWRALKKAWTAILLISLIQGGGQLWFVQFNTTLAAFVPSLFSLVAIYFLGRTKHYSQAWKLEDSKIMTKSIKVETLDTQNEMTLMQAFVPYVFLFLITLFVLLIPQVKTFLSILQLGFAFPETQTGLGYLNPAIESYSPFSPFTSAGFFLLISALVSMIYFSRKTWLSSQDRIAIMNLSFKKTMPSAIAVTCFIMLSRIMSGSGQILILAQGISAFLGNAYGLFTPLVGMLGAFITSSNMASNILFAEFQETTAHFLSLNVAAVLGAHTAGGAVGTAIAPGNIILGTTTAGILGQEGILLKKLLPITLFTTFVIGLVLWIILL